VKRTFWLFLAVLTAVGCGSDDGDEGDRAEAPPSARALATFESARIPFTFDHPKGFVAEKRPRANVLARVAVERGSRLNAIEVRRTARRELDPGRYLGEFRRDFARTVGPVQKRRERIGDLDVGVLEFETPRFSSSSYFFKGAGQTWQLECVADPEHRDEVDEACRAALESVDFGR
jgi:hypothetical protein